MSNLELDANKIRRTRERWRMFGSPAETAAPEPQRAPSVDTRSAHPMSARKQREKKMGSVIDGRTLRATGRTAQWNVRIRPDQKKEVQKRAKQKKLDGGASEYLEKALTFYMQAEDKGEV